LQLRIKDFESTIYHREEEMRKEIEKKNEEIQRLILQKEVEKHEKEINSMEKQQGIMVKLKKIEQAPPKKSKNPPPVKEIRNPYYFWQFNPHYYTVSKSQVYASEEITVSYDFTTFDNNPQPLKNDGWIGLVPTSVTSRNEVDNDAHDVSHFRISSEKKRKRTLKNN